MNSDEREQRATDALDDPAAEIGEEAIAILTDAEVLAHVPLLKLGIAAARIVESIRGRALLKKLEAFLRGLDSVTREQRAVMIVRLSEDREYSETVGEYLIEYLDRINGRRKALMSAAVFSAFARFEIDRPTLHSLCHAIDVVLPDYLRSARNLAEEGPFFRADENLKDDPTKNRSYRPEIASLQALAAAGLVFSQAVFDGMRYDLTNLGHVFIGSLRLDLLPY